MSGIRASCPICFSALGNENAYAVKRCGHTFHKDCVGRWVKSCKNCPSCRKNITENDVIKLYFHETGLDLSQVGTGESDVSDSKFHETLNKLEEVSQKLEIEKSKLAKAKDDLSILGNENAALRRQYADYDSCVTALNRMRVKNRQLEGFLKDSKHVSNDLLKCKERLKASEFYRVIKAGEKGDSVFDDYLTENGKLEFKNFELLMQKQFKHNRKQLREANDTIAKLKRQLLKEKNKSTTSPSITKSLPSPLTSKFTSPLAAEKEPSPSPIDEPMLPVSSSVSVVADISPAVSRFDSMPYRRFGVSVHDKRPTILMKAKHKQQQQFFKPTSSRRQNLDDSVVMLD